MAAIPYTPTPSSIPRFLQHIQSAGGSSKVTTRYLASVGFRSTNDRALIGVLKALDFIDSSGMPTVRWRNYRDKDRAPSVLAGAIRHAYGDLFAVYPDACQKDDEAIRNFFSSRSDLGESTLALAVRTFKTLCGKANFQGDDVVQEVTEDISKIVNLPAVQPGRRSAGPAAGAPIININIQLQLPPTEDASIYEKLFEAMRKNLFSDGSSS